MWDKNFIGGDMMIIKGFESFNDFKTFLLQEYSKDLPAWLVRDLKQSFPNGVKSREEINNLFKNHPSSGRVKFLREILRSLYYYHIKDYPEVEVDNRVNYIDEVLVEYVNRIVLD